MSRKSSPRIANSSWDPMLEDYQNPRFNTYLQGPGSRLDLAQQPWSSRTDQGKGPYKLYVNYLPPDITEAGLENIFLNYGQPLKVFKNPPLQGSTYTWGFIFYAKHREAEWAIRDLNGKPPYHLQVQFARTDAEKERLRQEQLETEIFEKTLEDQPLLLVERDPLFDFEPRARSRGRGRGLLQYYQHQHIVRPRPGSVPGYLLNDMFDEYDPEDIHGNYINSGLYEANRALMDLSFTVDSSGERRLSSGRGYHMVRNRQHPRKGFVQPTFSQEETTKFRELLDRTYERIENGRYMHGKPLPAGVVGSCRVCSKVSPRRCQRCLEWYCSRECQLTDWPNHKSVCIEVPLLENASEQGSGQRNLNKPTGAHKRERERTPESSPQRDGGGDENSKICNSHVDESKTNNQVCNRVEGSKPEFSDSSFVGKPFGSPENSSRVLESQKPNSISQGSENQKRIFANQDKDNQSKSFGVLENGQKKNFSGQGNGQKKNYGSQGNESQIKNSGGLENFNGKFSFGSQGRASFGNSVGDQRNEGFKKNFGGQGNSPRKSFGGQASNRPVMSTGIGAQYDGYGSDSRQQVTDGSKKNFGTGFDGPKKSFSGQVSDGSKMNFGGQGSDGPKKSFGGQVFDGAKRSNNTQGPDGSRRNSGYQGPDGARKTNAYQGSDGNRKNNGYQGPDGSRKNNVGQVPEGSKKNFFGHGQDSKNVGTRVFGNQNQKFGANKSMSRDDTHFGGGEGAGDSSKDSRFKSSIVNGTSPVKSSVLGKDLCESVQELPGEVFSEVKVTLPVAPMECWVQLQSKNDDLMAVMSDMLTCCNSLPISNPMVGTICAAPYVDEIWYRVCILSLKPEVRVFYIDFGNEETCQCNQLKDLPPSALKLPAQAIKIKLAPGTSSKHYQNLQEENVLHVKPVEKLMDDSVVVHVAGEVYEVPSSVQHSTSESSVSNYKELRRPNSISLKQTTPQASSPRALLPISIISTLKAGMSGYLEYSGRKNTETFIASIAFLEFKEKYGNLLSTMDEDIAKLPEDNFRPNAKDLVMALSSDKSWNRAYTLAVTNNDYQVAFCDSPVVVERVTKVKKIPVEYLTIPEMSVHFRPVEFHKTEQEVLKLFQCGATFQYDVKSSSLEEATIVLKTLEEGYALCTGTLSRWTPPHPTSNNLLKYVELRNGACILTSFLSTKRVFVRPLHKSASEIHHKVLQEVAGHCLSVDDLNHTPSIGELVASKFSVDGNYYRAVVKMIISADTFSVTYLDFGNTENVRLKDLKPLSEKLKTYPCSAAEVQLKGVIDKPLTNEAARILAQFIVKETELKLEICESNSEVNVYLPDGSLLNDKLNKALEPNGKRTAKGENPPSGNVYYYTNMDCLELPVGQTVDFIVLSILSLNTVVGCCTGNAMAAQIQETLHHEVNDYCKTQPTQKCLPQPTELCFAKFEGDWYRAVSQKIINNRAEVMFIDYGNVSLVETSDICQMTRKFSSVPAAATICKIKGIPEDVSENLRKRVGELIVQDSLLTVKVVEKKSACTYEIEVPSVMATLVKEGLLSAL